MSSIFSTPKQFKPRPIFFVGFMGVGKSTVGSQLAKKLRRTFIDLDTRIESISKQSIEDLFSQGEEVFRDTETRALVEASQSHAIVATGGGAPLREKNRSLMKKVGTVIYLYAEFPIILERLAKDTYSSKKRPLFPKNDSPYSIEKVNSLFESRLSLYSFAEIQIDTTHLSIDQVVEECAKLTQNESTF